MRVSRDLHTNTIWPVGVGTLSAASFEGLVRCDVCKQLDYIAMSTIESKLQFLNEDTTAEARWYQRTKLQHSFLRAALPFMTD